MYLTCNLNVFVCIVKVITARGVIAHIHVLPMYFKCIASVVILFQEYATCISGLFQMHFKHVYFDALCVFQVFFQCNAVAFHVYLGESHMNLMRILKYVYNVIQSVFKSTVCTDIFMYMPCIGDFTTIL